MESVPLIFVKLYLPLMLALVAILVLFTTTTGEKRTVMKLKPFLDFIQFEISVSNILIVRSLLILGVPAFLSPYLFYDYTALFPQHLHMEVFYDQPGIRESMTAFPPDQLASLPIPKDYSPYQAQYFEKVDSEIKKTLGIEKFFSLKERSAHSRGETYIVVEQIKGWHSYHVVKAEGDLTHIIELPNSPIRQFYTRFEKLDSKDDYIDLTLSDLFVRRHLMLRVRNKQILVESSKAQRVLFKFTVVGITKVTVFPWPSISNTIYFAEFEGVGLVPVAYAIYRFESAK